MLRFLSSPELQGVHGLETAKMVSPCKKEEDEASDASTGEIGSEVGASLYSINSLQIDLGNSRMSSSSSATADESDAEAGDLATRLTKLEAAMHVHDELEEMKHMVDVLEGALKQQQLVVVEERERSETLAAKVALLEEKLSKEQEEVESWKAKATKFEEQAIESEKVLAVREEQLKDLDEMVATVSQRWSTIEQVVEKEQEDASEGEKLRIKVRALELEKAQADSQLKTLHELLSASNETLHELLNASSAAPCQHDPQFAQKVQLHQEKVADLPSFQSREQRSDFFMPRASRASVAVFGPPTRLTADRGGSCLLPATTPSQPQINTRRRSFDASSPGSPTMSPRSPGPAQYGSIVSPRQTSKQQMGSALASPVTPVTMRHASRTMLSAVVTPGCPRAQPRRRSISNGDSDPNAVQAPGKKEEAAPTQGGSVQAKRVFQPPPPTTLSMHGVVTGLRTRSSAANLTPSAPSSPTYIVRPGEHSPPTSPKWIRHVELSPPAPCR